MTIGEIIRKYRKKENMTQEIMARTLGVSTPAVNKWENGITTPDITLLAPIARLLHISLEELLSFRQDLSPEETGRYMNQLNDRLQKENYDTVFESAIHKLEEYPNAYPFILQITQLLNSAALIRNIENTDQHKTLLMWMERCLQAEDETIRTQAAIALHQMSFQKKEYDQALTYANTLSLENPRRKHLIACVLSRTGKHDEAYRYFEEQIMTFYMLLKETMTAIRHMYLDDKNDVMAKRWADIQSSLSTLFDYGLYQKWEPLLELAIAKKDPARTAEIMKNLVDHVETLQEFTDSSLYQHITFKKTDPAFFSQIKAQLVRSMNDAEFDYMNDNPSWKSLKYR